MSGRTLVRQKRKLGDDMVAWRAEVFRARGWSSKTAAQGTMQLEMAAAFQQYETDFPSKADALGQADLDAGKEFQSYVVTLKRFEALPLPRPKAEVEALRIAAQRYLDHYGQHSDRQKKQSRTVRKKRECEQTLADLRKYDLRNEMAGLGTPPWDSKTAMKAASLKATLDFESLPDGEQVAEELSGQHTNPAFWVNKGTPEGAQKKSFLFKPAVPDKPSDIDGFPDGAETVREALTGRAADVLNGMTGIDFRMPETHVVTIAHDKLPDGAVADDGSGVVAGSLQQFAATRGEMKAGNLAARKRIPPEDCQKIAILDAITLNMDRHAGNLMMGGTKDAPSLVPIDHGLTFPPQAAAGEIGARIGDKHNALLGIPGAHQPFSNAMKANIARIDPKAIVEAMRKERGVIDDAHGGADVVSDDALEMTRRSAMFLKEAAATLSPAAVQIALGQNANALFDPTIDDTEFDRRAHAAIAAAAPNQAAYAEYFTMPPEQQVAMEERLGANGWPNDRGKALRSWMLGNLDLALKLYRSDTRNPTLERDLEQLLGRQQLDTLLQTQSLRTIDTNRDNLAPPVALPPVVIDAQVQADILAINTAFPRENLNANRPAQLGKVLQQWGTLNNRGGLAGLDQAIASLGLKGADVKDAYYSVENALITLGRAAAQQTAGTMNFDQAAMDRSALVQRLDYIESLAALLPMAERQKTMVVVNKHRASIGKRKQVSLRVLDGVQLATLDRVRRDVKKNIDALDEALLADAKVASPDSTTHGASAILEGLRGDAASGNVKAASQQVSDMRVQYNKPRA